MIKWIGVIQPSQPKRLLRRSGLVIVSCLAVAVYGLGPSPAEGLRSAGGFYALAAANAYL